MTKGDVNSLTIKLYVIFHVQYFKQETFYITNPFYRKTSNHFSNITLHQKKFVTMINGSNRCQLKHLLTKTIEIGSYCMRLNTLYSQ